MRLFPLKRAAAGRSFDAGRQLPLQLEQDDASAWRVRRSTRARRLSARVHRDSRVEIVVPQRASLALVEEFIARHRGWIEEKVAIARAAAPPAEAFPPEQVLLQAFGESYRIHLEGGEGRPRVRQAQSGLLVVSGLAGDAPAMREALRRWLMAHARLRLELQLRETAREFGFTFRELSLRRQRTRWGSCSARGTISLNVCLAFQPAEVLRYLMIHELSHTRHMNHSARFWACVEQCCPDWRRLDRQLLEGWRHVPRWVFA